MTGNRIDPMQLREAADWARGFTPPPTALDLVGQRVGVAGVLAVARLLRPDFIEVRGCVLLPWAHEVSAFNQWWADLEGDRSAIEAAINHMHLWDVFAESDDPLADQALDEVGELIAESWRQALGQAYPDSKFRVAFSRDAEEYGPTVTFHSAL